MNSENFHTVFRGLGGAAAGAGIATAGAAIVVSVVPLLVPIAGAVLAGIAALAADRADAPKRLTAD